MNVLDKQRLCRIYDDSPDACGMRLAAARLSIGLSQSEAAAALGVRNTTLNNAEKGRNYPSLEVMRWLFRAHRIDFNFILAGEFSQLPGDVQEAIFAALEIIHAQHERDQKAT